MKKKILIILGIITAIVLNVILVSNMDKYFKSKEKYMKTYNGEVIDYEVDYSYDPTTHIKEDYYDVKVDLGNKVVEVLASPNEPEIGEKVEVYLYKGTYSFTPEGTLLTGGDIKSWAYIFGFSILLLAIPFILINFTGNKKKEQNKND